jgi:hypothetical protein
MAARKKENRPRARQKRASAAGPKAAGKQRPLLTAPPKGAGRPDTGLPGGGQGRVDFTGIMPEGIRVDPNLTEGHPGYQESGGSEILPTQRLRGGQKAGRKKSRG